eukprot:TRINITY_DN23269_c0_g1_i2.p1 TRINITY_DN23269_c0_g1~~TRINITY_DN23269_c0_g1_i2.p1  ORF type:complete len:213 (-),score=51.33 TRINITY_DN23269_c0_g1_i2:159-797(-)
MAFGASWQHAGDSQSHHQASRAWALLGGRAGHGLVSELSDSCGGWSPPQQPAGHQRPMGSIDASEDFVQEAFFEYTARNPGLLDALPLFEEHTEDREAVEGLLEEACVVRLARLQQARAHSTRCLRELASLEAFVSRLRLRRWRRMQEDVSPSKIPRRVGGGFDIGQPPGLLGSAMRKHRSSWSDVMETLQDMQLFMQDPHAVLRADEDEMS